MRSTAFREQHGKSIRSIVIDSTRESTISRRQATRELFGIKQACVYNPSSQRRLRAFSTSQTAAMRKDPDIAQLRGLSLGVFISATPTMDLPLMQSRILDVTARARSAGHLADWQREGDIVIGWIEQLKSQGRATAPGALGAYLWGHWVAECKRQQALNRPAITAAETAGTNPVQQWFPPESTPTASRLRSRVGPIGLIIDLHSQWHDELLRASSLLTSMGASIIIPFGPHQQRTYHWGGRSAPTTESQSALQRRILQWIPQYFNVPTRAPTALQSPGKSSAHNSLCTEGTITDPTQPQPPTSTPSAKGVAVRAIPLTAAIKKSTPTGWNPAHRSVLFADTAAGRAVAREAKGTNLSCLPPSGVVWDSISQQCFPPRQLVLTIGPLPNLPASHRGLLP